MATETFTCWVFAEPGADPVGLEKLVAERYADSSTQSVETVEYIGPCMALDTFEGHRFDVHAERI